MIDNIDANIKQARADVEVAEVKIVESKKLMQSARKVKCF